MTEAAQPHVSLRWQVLSLVAPVTATYTVEGFASLVPILVAGHDSSANSDAAASQLAAVGLGNTALTFIAFVIGSGWSGGQDALVSQAFGRGDFDKARQHLHQCQAWMLAFALLCSTLLFHVQSGLQLFGVANAGMAALTGRYVTLCIPGIWFEFQYDALRKFLLNQQLPTPGLVVLLLGVPMHASCCYVLCHVLQMETMRALGLATTLRAACCFCMLAVYTTVSCPRPSCTNWWKMWSAKDMVPRGLAEYARVGVPSTAMLAVDWLAFEMLTVLAGRLSDGPELAAHVAAMGLSEYLYMVVRGSPKAATAMVGAATGNRDLAAVWRSFKACALCCAFLSSLLMLCFVFGHETLVSMLLRDAGTTRDTLASLMPLVALQMLIDAGNSLVQGAHAGLGNHSKVTLGFVLFCWIVQLPLAYVFAFKLGWGVRGLRLACLVGVGLDFVYNIALLVWTLRPHRFAQLARQVSASAPEVLPMREYKELKAA